MTVKVPENPLYCGSQNGKAKSDRSRLVARLARFVRKAGLGYEDWRYVSRRVRQKCDLHPAAKPKRLPRVLTADQFRAFYKAVDEADDVQHSLMLRLLFYTGVRVSELCNIEVSDVDLENCKVFVNQGKGSKDRYVLFGTSFAMALRAHIAAHPDNRHLFQTRRCGRFSTRRVEQVVKLYAERAGVTATPHTLRHQCVTFLTKTSGMADAELQLITGHARRETLSIYQHVAVDGEMADKYQQAMKEAGL
jgi:integrase